MSDCAIICENPGACLPEPFQRLLAAVLSVEFGEVVFRVKVHERRPTLAEKIEGLQIEVLGQTTRYKLDG